MAPMRDIARGRHANDDGGDDGSDGENEHGCIVDDDDEDEAVLADDDGVTVGAVQSVQLMFIFTPQIVTLVQQNTPGSK